MARSSTVAIGLVGHAGGWDELVLVAAPIVVFVLLQVVGRRERAEREETVDGGSPGAGAP